MKGITPAMPSWIALVPPLIVLITSFMTKKIVPSLCIGIATAALITSSGSLTIALGILIDRFFDQLDLSNLYIFGFLISLGILISLLNFTGGISAYSSLIRKKATSKQSTQYASVFLSLLSSFDDYFSCITTGCVMRPLIDMARIPRVKFAFLIDSLAAPLVLLVPISSWIAMVTMQLEKSGIGNNAHDNPLVIADPFNAYIHIIPFISYSFIIIASVIFIIHKGISFGTMRKHELIAEQTGNLFGGKKSFNMQSYTPDHGSLFDFLMPLGTLFITIFACILYKGNFYLFGGSNGIVQAFQQTNIFFALCMGSTATLIISMSYFIYKKKINTQNILSEISSGFGMMGPTIVILFLAWVMSSLLINDLKSGQYLAYLLSGSVSTAFLPAFFFIASAITSIAIGSSWGTIATFVPLATPMLIQLSGLPTPITLEQLPMLLPLLGAIFAGSIAGDHISPLSSTTIMSSNSSGAYHADHVKTQFEYAMPALIASTISCLISGFLIAQRISIVATSMASIVTGILISIAILNVLNGKES